VKSPLHPGGIQLIFLALTGNKALTITTCFDVQDKIVFELFLDTPAPFKKSITSPGYWSNPP